MGHPRTRKVTIHTHPEQNHPCHMWAGRSRGCFETRDVFDPRPRVSRVETRAHDNITDQGGTLGALTGRRGLRKSASRSIHSSAVLERGRAAPADALLALGLLHALA